jgi:hypothetical protein
VHPIRATHAAPVDDNEEEKCALNLGDVIEVIFDTPLDQDRIPDALFIIAVPSTMRSAGRRPRRVPQNYVRRPPLEKESAKLAPPRAMEPPANAGSPPGDGGLRFALSEQASRLANRRAGRRSVRVVVLDRRARLGYGSRSPRAGWQSAGEGRLAPRALAVVLHAPGRGMEGETMRVVSSAARRPPRRRGTPARSSGSPRLPTISSSCPSSATTEPRALMGRSATLGNLPHPLVQRFP